MTRSELGRVSTTVISRSASGTGSPRMSVPYTTLNANDVAPTPSPIVSTETSESSGVRFLACCETSPAPGARRLIHEALQREQSEDLAEARYERRGKESCPPVPRRHQPGRLLIAEGSIALERSPVRVEAKRTAAASAICWQVAAVPLWSHWSVEMYARGLSTLTSRISSEAPRVKS